MAQRPIEIILAKQLASHLAHAVFLVGQDGALLFYNEPAEALLGLRFDETGPMPLKEWGTMFTPTDEHGQPLPPEDLPLAVALRERTPVRGEFRIHGLDGVDRHLDVVALPIEGQGERHLGAMAIFSESSP